MKRNLMLVAFAVMAVLAFSGTARADSVSGTLALLNCGGSGPSDCPAATYTFNVTPNSATLTIAINGPVNNSNDLITGVDLGFTSSNNLSNVTLVSGPGGAWHTSTGSLSNSGCGSNSGAFICSFGSGIKIVNGGTYTWTWDFTLGSDTIDGASDVHIGTNYGPHNGFIVSETGAQATTTVPEPGAGILALLGFGLGAVPIFRRRFHAF